MTQRTMDNYTRQMGDQPIHTNYRFDIEFQEEEQDYSWSVFTRGKWQLIDNAEETLDEAVRLQKLYPTRDFRVVRRVERETRNEPYHPAFIRAQAGL